MKNSNDSLILGIDHGYGNIKTANKTFGTGVYVSDTEPAFKDNLLTWNGKYYTIGEGHKEFVADKMQDMDYYVLTLAAVAYELRARGLREVSDNHCKEYKLSVVLNPKKSRGIPHNGYMIQKYKRLSTGLTSSENIVNTVKN